MVDSLVHMAAWMEGTETASASPTIAERRAQPRTNAASWAAQIETAEGSFACAILNVSQGGVMLQVAAPLQPQQKVTLTIRNLAALRAEVVWHVREKQKAGIRFTEPPDAIARIFNGSLPL